ncbi:MAG: 3-oxoacyl-[acyl-carrier-protein] synthase III C-terminal domain-containing protein [Planctomycetota bacterium]|jgi:predicted naringenin-chalcone synthase
MLFSDGAAMVAVSPIPSNVELLYCRCTHLPKDSDMMKWFADDHGLRLTLSSRLPDIIAENVGQAMDDTLANLGMTRDGIDHWLVHPGGPRILDAVETSLNLEQGSLSDSRAVLREYGNMSSSTIFFIMQRFFERAADGLCAAIAFGPGLTIEIAILQITCK